MSQLGDINIFRDANLKAYWKLENTVDSTSNANTLTNNGTATFVAGKYNNCANLVNASNQYFSIADSASLALTGDFSVVGWINFASLPANGTFKGFFTKFPGAPNWSFTCEIGRDDVRGGYTVRTYISSTGSNLEDHYVNYPTPSTGVWYHIVFVWTAASHKLEIYWNGVSQGTDTTGTLTSQYDNSQQILLGAYGSGGVSNFWDGKIDDVGIFNRVLTAREILDIYNQNISADMFL